MTREKGDDHLPAKGDGKVTPRIVKIGQGDAAPVLEAAHLFDNPPVSRLVDEFLRRDGHHLLIAYVEGEPAGFVTGVEVTHPDKAVEMLIYELGVAAEHRRRGIGRALVESMRELARDMGCRGMWVALEPDDEPATATYRAAGAGPIEPAAIMSWDLLQD